MPAMATKSTVTEFRADNPSAIQRLFGVGSVRRPYENVILVQACVSATAEACASAPFEVLSEKSEEADLKSPWTKLFNKPNPNMDQPAEFWEAHASWCDMRGECIWYLEYRADDGKRTSDTEIPESIWPLSPDFFTPIIEPGNPVPMGWRMSIPNMGYLVVDTDQIVQFKTWNPEDMLRGLDKIKLLQRTLETFERTRAYNDSFFENGAQPGGVLTTEDNISEDQATEVQQRWEDRHLGSGKASRVAVLGNGLKYTPMGTTHTEMQFLEQQKWNQDEILTAFRINRAVIGMVDGLTYQNAREARKIFWENKIIPMLTRWANTVSVQFEIKCRFALQSIDVLTVGLQDKVNAASGLIRLGYPINMAARRVNLGMPDVDWGDTPPHMMYDVPQEVAAAVLLATIKDTRARGTVARVMMSKGMLTEEKALPAREVLEVPAVITEKSRRLASYERHRETNASYIQLVLDPSEIKFQRRYAQYINNLFVAQLKKIDGAKGWRHSKGLFKAEGDDVLIDLSVWQEELVKVTKPIYTQIVNDSLEVAADLTGGAALGVNNPRVAAFMREKAIKVKGVTKRVREDIRAQILQGFAKDESVAQIKERLQTLKDFNKDPVRTLRVARTETAQAASGSRFIQFDADGVKKKSWSSSGDEVVRDDHVAFEEEGVVDLDFDYMELTGGDGELQYPSDMNGPADQVINCRCSSLPEL